MKKLSLMERLGFAVVVGLGIIPSRGADATLLGPPNSTRLWLNGAGWSGGSYPGEIRNADSLNKDVATITNASLVPIDFTASGANGQLALGAIVVSRVDSLIWDATVRPNFVAGTLTLNGATVNGMPNTILAHINTSGAGFELGDAFGGSTARFTAVRLGAPTNVIQVASGQYVSIANGTVISERTGGSGILLTSDSGQTLGMRGSLFASASNTFSGPVRIENGTSWYLGARAQSLGLSLPMASNLTLDNGALHGNNVRMDRLFTLGQGGGHLIAYFAPAEDGPFAFTNTGAIGFEGSGPRTLTLSGYPHNSGTTYGAFAPSLGDPPSGGVTSLVLTDQSDWKLTGSNTYSGSTTISNWAMLELKENGSIANSPEIVVNRGNLRVSGVTGGANFDGVRFALAGGQTLKGNIGGVFGTMGVRAGARISPGLGIGFLATDGIVFNSPSAMLEMEIVMGAGMDADSLRVFGGLDLGGATLSITLQGAPVTTAASQTFLLISNDMGEAITNYFGTVNLFGDNASGYQVSIDYAFMGTDSLGRIGDGNDLAITLAPASVPPLFSLSIRVTNDVVTLNWPATNNQAYVVEYKDSLTGSDWNQLPSPVVATGTNASATDVVGGHARFYRVKTQ